MIVYDPFWQFLKDNGITTYTLINTYGISKGLIARMKHNEPITTYTINHLCETLSCNLSDIVEYVSSEDNNNKI